MPAKLGSLYRRKKKLPDGTKQILPTWWIKFSKNGEVFRESTGSEKRSEAEQFLKRRLGEVVSGKFVGLPPERVTLGELFKDVVEDYQIYERKSTSDVESRLRNHLVPVFGDVRAVDFSTQLLKRYIAARRKEEAKNGTINRELAIIRRAFTLAGKCDPPKVVRVPHISMLKENNVRSGFLEYEGYESLRAHLPWYIRPLFVTAYHIGGRRGELTSIQWNQVDFRASQIRLGGDVTKNEEPRTLPIYGEMAEWLTSALHVRNEKFPDCPWVFYTDDGKRLYWFYAAWETACANAGMPDLLFHDLRRSAVRNMERAGIPRKVAMSISGHKTENVYRRYDIVGERDLSDAMARMNDYLAAAKGQAKNTAHDAKTDDLGTLLGTPKNLAANNFVNDEPGHEPKL